MSSARDYIAPFHISILVHSISEAIDFYHRDLGFPILREYDKARHFDCFGNQMVVHERVGYDATLFQTSVENDDFVIDEKKKKYRVITFIWYLNNVEEGGETEFWKDYNIKPTTGKLVLFPASWTFPHRGKMPISDDKYIITGWIYLNI